MKNEIKNIVKILKEGKLILCPTDTIWGISCDFRNEKAIEKIYRIKKRSNKKSMIILTDNINKISPYIKNIPKSALNLINSVNYPLTIIYEDIFGLPKNLINEDGSLAIRVTREKFTKLLINEFKNPIVSTSANISNEKTPKNFYEINSEIIKAVNYVVSYGQNNKKLSKASSIVKLYGENKIKIIR
ncbi:MAG: threonylcarbamoyl-AMP synthase [Bacteroidetes bacterium 4572_128]|nr:MAG: threonylcarbamoyl-AMP synthase [Bacteroidetes bacterium 4572_128]